MPIYEYHCTSCGKDFEKMQSINNEERATECVYCGKQAERKVSVTSYHLTGSGFYNTDKKLLSRHAVHRAHAVQAVPAIQKNNTISLLNNKKAFLCYKV